MRIARGHEPLSDKIWTKKLRCIDMDRKTLSKWRIVLNALTGEDLLIIKDEVDKQVKELK